MRANGITKNCFINGVATKKLPSGNKLYFSVIFIFLNNLAKMVEYFKENLTEWKSLLYFAQLKYENRCNHYVLKQLTT